MEEFMTNGNIQNQSYREVNDRAMKQFVDDCKKRLNADIPSVESQSETNAARNKGWAIFFLFLSIINVPIWLIIYNAYPESALFFTGGVLELVFVSSTALFIKFAKDWKNYLKNNFPQR